MCGAGTFALRSSGVSPLFSPVSGSSGHRPQQQPLPCHAAFLRFLSGPWQLSEVWVVHLNETYLCTESCLGEPAARRPIGKDEFDQVRVSDLAMFALANFTFATEAAAPLMGYLSFTQLRSLLEVPDARKQLRTHETALRTLALKITSPKCAVVISMAAGDSFFGLFASPLSVSLKVPSAGVPGSSARRNYVKLTEAASAHQRLVHEDLLVRNSKVARAPRAQKAPTPVIRDEVAA